MTRELNEDQAIEKIENAKQAMSETASSWRSRCFQIMAAIGINYGDNPDLPDEGGQPSPQTPSEQFSAWINEGPRLAKAAGCHVGIKVTEAKGEQA